MDDAETKGSLSLRERDRVRGSKRLQCQTGNFAMPHYAFPESRNRRENFTMRLSKQGSALIEFPSPQPSP